MSIISVASLKCPTQILNSRISRNARIISFCGSSIPLETPKTVRSSLRPCDLNSSSENWFLICHYTTRRPGKLEAKHLWRIVDIDSRGVKEDFSESINVNDTAIKWSWKGLLFAPSHDLRIRHATKCLLFHLQCNHKQWRMDGWMKRSMARSNTKKLGAHKRDFSNWKLLLNGSSFLSRGPSRGGWTIEYVIHSSFVH